MKKLVLKKFNKKGEDKFEIFFDKKLKNRSTPVPYKYLNASDFTEEVSKKEIEIDTSIKFESAFEFGKYLSTKLKDVENIRFETGIFHWLTLAFFDQLFPGPSGGSQKIKYILPQQTGNWKKHLVRLRWELYDKFNEKSLVYLTKQVNNWSDEEESISASPTLISSETIIDLYRKLYFRIINNKPTIISNRNIPGNHRELTTELSIYQLNFDIGRMTVDELLELLGSDFKTWVDKKK